MFSSRMTQWCTNRSMAAAVVIGSLKIPSHFENGRLLVSSHLTDTDVECEVRVLALCDAHGVVQRGGYMGCHKRVRRRIAEQCSLALIERRVQQGVQIHRSLGLLRESRRRHRHDPM